MRERFEYDGWGYGPDEQGLDKMPTKAQIKAVFDASLSNDPADWPDLVEYNDAYQAATDRTDSDDLTEAADLSRGDDPEGKTCRVRVGEEGFQDFWLRGIVDEDDCYAWQLVRPDGTDVPDCSIDISEDFAQVSWARAIEYARTHPEE